MRRLLLLISVLLCSLCLKAQPYPPTFLGVQVTGSLETVVEQLEAAGFVKEHLAELYEDRDENFGNARDVRNLFEKIVANQANRVAGMDSPTTDDILTITRADLQDLMDLPLVESEGNDGDKAEIP